MGRKKLDLSDPVQREQYLKARAGLIRGQGKRWCSNHPTRFWGKKQDGEYFDRCAGGFGSNTPCKIGGE